MGRPSLRKKGAMTPAERQQRYRRKLAREKLAAEPGVKAARRATREQQLAGRILALPDQRFGVIYADPPWRFEPRNRETGMDRAADNHYPTMPTAEIAALDVLSRAAADCVLFLWATAPMLPEALEVMKAWGFEYRSNQVWLKTRLGTGYWARSLHEHLLIGTRGRVPAPAPGAQPCSVVELPAGAHSAKPEWFRETIERLYPSLPRLELFARTARPGWTVWGKEAPLND